MGYELQAGKLRHRVAIQRATESRNALGESILTFATIATRWAEIRPLSGKESDIAKRIDARTTHKIVIRYYEGLKTSDRFLWNSRYFNISDIINILERDKLMVCTCIEEGLANG